METIRTDRAVFTPQDFVLWKQNEILVISPKFQRRAVWRTPARSYFIDTILRDMVVPPIYLRTAQDRKSKKVVREVVDGQQRVRSVLEFMSDDGYRLSNSLNAPWAGKRFDQLGKPEQDKIKFFGFPVETFHGITDAQVLEIFCRLNMNGIPLNNQELRNGKFFGRFKQLALKLSLRYLEFWRKHKIFTEINIARMLEVELTSELLIAGNDGMQDKKKSIDDFYEKWELEYTDRDRDKERLSAVLNEISETFKDNDLAASAFRRPPLFYTLYCVVYHRLYGLPKAQRSTPKKRLTADDRDSLREAVIKLSEILSQSKDPTYLIPNKYARFVAAYKRQTDNITPRKIRFDTLFDEAF